MVEVLERGDISFFWRPAVQPADGPPLVSPGVQSFFLVLSTSDGKHRRLRVGKKRMPSRSGERLWARVERVGSFRRVVGAQLEDERYTTKTRGERFQPGARPIAQGSYEIVRHDDHFHLSYRVDSTEPDEVPDEVRVPEAGDSIVLFKRTPPARAVWTTAGSPAQLREEGAQLVLVGADDDLDQSGQ